MSEIRTAVPDLQQTYEQIKAILTDARHRAYRAINTAMVAAYWEIGRVIVEEEQKGEGRANYGQQIVEGLSRRLRADFGKGFDRSNLWHMRTFYLYYPILDALRPELSWTHYRILLRVENPDARSFYEKEALAAHWSTRELERQIHSLLFERLALSRDKEGVMALAQKGHELQQPADLIKDPYVLEFTGIPQHESFLESDLEQALIDKLREFLLELGRGFAFMARQQRITLDGKHFWIDLVFYNRLTRCFVLIDLKVGNVASTRCFCHDLSAVKRSASCAHVREQHHGLRGRRPHGHESVFGYRGQPASLQRDRLWLRLAGRCERRA